MNLSVSNKSPKIPAFLRGVLRTFDLFSVIPDESIAALKSQSRRSPGSRIRSDWTKVGEDLRQSMGYLKKKHSL